MAGFIAFIDYLFYTFIESNGEVHTNLSKSFQMYMICCLISNILDMYNFFEY